MKTWFLAALFTGVLSNTGVRAQDKQNLTLGGTLGFGHSWVSGTFDNAIGKEFKPAIDLGARMLYHTDPRWAFGADLNFRMEGVKMKSRAGAQQISSQTNYLRLQPKAVYFFGATDAAFRPKISLGPSVGLLLGGRTNLSTDLTTDLEYPSKEIFFNGDWGIAGGIGFNYRLNRLWWLNADLDYTHGFGAIVQDQLYQDVHNRSLILHIGATYNLYYTGRR